MAEKRPPLPKYNTPAGVARYPHLNKPDTRFHDDGVYKCDVLLDADAPDTIELIAYLEDIRDKRFKAEKKEAKKGRKFVKAPVFEVDIDDSGDETGKVIIKTKLNAVGRNKAKDEEWKNEPKLFDSNGNPLPSEVQVWSGTKLIVAGTVNAYAMVNKVLVEKDGKMVEKKITSVGVSLKCKGVQIIELVTGGEATAESFGFGNIAGGYETDAAKVGLGVSDSEDDADDVDDDDPDF